MVQLLVILALFLLAGAPRGGQAQAPEPVTTRVWQMQDGLTDPLIHALVQGPDRYLWIGTPRGLVRFDGQNFLPWEGKGRDELANGVTCIAVASDGAVYVGTEGAGLVRFRGAQVEVLGQQQGLTDSIIRAITEDSSHRIWIGTDHDLFVQEGDRFREALPQAQYRDRFREAVPADQHPSLGSSAILQDRAGGLWSGGSHLFRISGERLDIYRLPTPRGSSMRIKAMAEDTDGSLYVGAVSGLYVRNAAGEFELVPAVTGSVRTFGRLPSGELLVGTAGFGVYVRRGGRFERLALDDLPSQTLLSATTDGEGNSWIGAQGGLVRLSRSDLQLIALPTNSSDFGSISRDADGSLWFCSNGVYRVTHNEATRYRLPWLGSIIVRTVHREGNGDLWIGTAGNGAFLVEPGGRRRQFTSEIGTNYIRGFLPSSRGGLWISTDGGVALWRDGRMTNYHEIANAPHTLALSMSEDEGGRLWIATQKGLFLLQDGAFQPLPPGLRLPPGPVWTVYGKKSRQAGETSALWLGTNSGLYLWRESTLRRVPLADHQVVFHMMRAGGYFWLSGSTEIVRVPESDLLHTEDVQAAATQTFSVTDAFPAATLFSGMQLSGVIESDGSVWYPSSLGPIHVQVPAENRAPGAVPMFVRALVDGHAAGLASPVVLRPGTQTVQVDYTPVMLGSQAGLRFRQRLTPDGDWTAPTTARTAVFTGMAVGDHTYQVQAIDSRQRVVGEAEFTLRQRAFFYQRLWFWAVVCLALLAAGVVVYRLRVRQLQIGFVAVSQERGRLAREMHDTLIQGCQGVSALLEAVVASGVDGAQRDEWLRTARDQIKASIVDARAAVWDLRSQDTNESLESALRKMAQQEPGVHPNNISFALQGTEPRLPTGVAHELVMSTREALINAHMHSSARSIQLELVYRKKELSILVSDDGVGFAPGEGSARPGHYGLVGMQERMARINGLCKISSAPSQGTVVHLTYRYPDGTQDQQP